MEKTPSPAVAASVSAVQGVKGLSRHKRIPPRYAGPLHLFHGPLDPFPGQLPRTCRVSFYEHIWVRFGER